MRYVLRVELCDIQDPVIWRKLAVPMKLTFHGLHKMIQAAMGWKDSHLYSFKEAARSRYFHVVSPYAEEMGIDSTRISATNILWDYMNQYVPENQPRDKFYYEYDFGDAWLHEIDVVDLDRSNRTSPELLDGGGACPPEDCGGTHGFADIKKSLRTGKPSEIHGDSWVPWLEGCEYDNYDPDFFDLERGKLMVRGWNVKRG